MISNSPKEISINVLELFLHIITNNNRLKGLKGSTKMRKREYQFKFDSLLYNIKSNDDVKHRVNSNGNVTEQQTFSIFECN